MAVAGAVSGVAAVIAGGAGRRMGGGLAKAELMVGGRSIATRQVEALRAVFARVVAVANAPGPWPALGVEVVVDRRPGAGPLAGLEAALDATREHPGVVCVGGDMPFLSAELLVLLRDRAPAADAVAVRVDERVEPLLGRYASRCLPAIESQLAAGERAVHRLLARLAVSWIDDAELRAFDPALRSLINVNTPEDLARAEAMASLLP